MKDKFAKKKEINAVTNPYDGEARDTDNSASYSLKWFRNEFTYRLNVNSIKNIKWDFSSPL